MSVWQRHAVPWWPNPTVCITNKPPIITPTMRFSFIPTGISPKPPAAGPYTITAGIRLDDDSRPPTTVYTLSWSPDFPFSVGSVTNHQNANGQASVSADDVIPYVSASTSGSTIGRNYFDLLRLLRDTGLI